MLRVQYNVGIKETTEGVLTGVQKSKARSGSEAQTNTNGLGFFTGGEHPGHSLLGEVLIKKDNLSKRPNRTLAEIQRGGTQ